MRTAVRMIAGLMTFTLVSACAIYYPDLVKEGIVKIDVDDTKSIYFRDVNAYQKGEETAIWGEVWYAPWALNGPGQGHVDIDLALPHGQRIETRSVDLVRRRYSSRNRQRAYFRETIDGTLPKGTVIHISYQDEQHG
jgi:hypothetical protein